ncbi:large ribosomal subunit protein mL41-like [Antedon mediterranea]|uniref:large ribosomal subunit protein mL41-like n=1 Tax=Antedon mediterranea TaxID=105859 RepID=UPI003AF766B0
MPFLSNLFRGLRGADKHSPMTSKRGNKHYHPNRGTQSTVIRYGRRVVNIPEKIPEFIVPDLSNFQLKPYVSYKAVKPNEEPITAKQIFDACIAPKLIEDFKETDKEKKLTENVTR